jgi:hypothetical protein
MRGNVALKHLGLQGLQQAFVRCRPQIAGVNGVKHIRESTFTFRFKTCNQWPVFAGLQLDFDASLFCKAVKQRLDQVFLP